MISGNTMLQNVLKISIAIFCFNQLWAQSVCSEELTQAQKLYDDGILAQAQEKILYCLKKNGFQTNDEKTRAYRLLTLIALYTDQLDEAEKYMMALLSTNPDYRLNPAIEANEFTKLYQTFRTHPILTLGIQAGPNQNYVVVSQSKSTDNDKQLAHYTERLGFSGGIVANFHLKKSWTIHLEPSYVIRRFEQTQRLFQFTELKVSENQSIIEIPLAISYALGGYRIQGFIQGGIIVQHLLSSFLEANRNNFQNISIPLSTQFIAAKEMRNPLGYAGLLGVGFRYKIPRGFLFMKSQFLYGFTNQSLPTHRYTHHELLFQYGYVDDDFYLNQISLQIGYLYAFYKPKKLKKSQD
ncbi:MAG: PorT family protein [Cytophagales bacterium]|nr:PorT family protein [Cytophagales bacterium]MDW8384443.1 outer membrane beta-barrel protein [Flammeovirgaceae bacterium]